MNKLQKTIVVVCGAYILFSPALPQMFGIGGDYVRYWRMFGGVGQGIMKGTFTLTEADGAQQELTPLQVLDLERYPDTFHYTFDRIVKDIPAMAQVTSEFCQTHVDAGATLSFMGKVGVANGWGTLELEDVCVPKNTLIANQGPLS